ncbi:hypothetical protein CMI41_03155 [Candidatus Pacearchaeota archaeon]|jgi:hypothetical protein|nr:hypothetical protein [Candidatus Pacearchaeota archaeon]|tara:strand:+ start:32458 stop:32742 length:285 start_codon:yes stop_codon:yes gene_type:complete
MAEDNVVSYDGNNKGVTLSGGQRGAVIQKGKNSDQLRTFEAVRATRDKNHLVVEVHNYIAGSIGKYAKRFQKDIFRHLAPDTFRKYESQLGAVA